jgi:hypothetical protein
MDQGYYRPRYLPVGREGACVSLVRTANRVSVAGPENFSVGLCESQEGPQSVWKVDEQALRCCCRRLESGEVLSVLRSDSSLISCDQRGFCFSWVPQLQGPAV